METVTENSLITEKAAKQIEEAKNFLQNEVSELIITTEEQYVHAGKLIAEIKKRSKDLSELHKVEKAPHLEAGRKVDNEFFPTIRLLDEKAKVVDAGGKKFRQLQEELAAIEQKRLEDAAEAERKALEEQAGTKDQKAERLREKAQELTAKAAQTTDLFEVSRLLREAAKYENRACGYDERSEAKKEQAAYVVAPVVQAAIPPESRVGFNTRVSYGARITNIAMVLDHLKNGVPLGIQQEIVKWANAAARGSQGAASTIPGVEFYKN